MKTKRKPRVVELFAGVGGFRVGLNDVKLIDGRTIEKKNFDFVFFNQWEPNKKNQYAYNCYTKRFNEKFNEYHNMDISKIDKKIIPDHDLLVGGFPCQDYSVASTLKNSLGIEGKKGVLWWEIASILEIKRPKFVLLENVDRLLISPSKQRGRDFSLMLRTFDKLDYYVEWKVIDASDYGMPQKRKRVFIFACHKSTRYYNQEIKNNLFNIVDFVKENKNFFGKNFQSNTNVDMQPFLPVSIDKDLIDISNNFSAIYNNFGIMVNKQFHTFKTTPKYKGNITNLENIIEIYNLENLKNFFLDKNQLEKMQFFKDKKKINRTSKNGHKYTYSEGKMSFPDNLNKPGRTILTSEGSLNRSSHVILQNKIFRFLTPTECERLNMFPDNWTNFPDIPIKTRYFLMGNALVCGILKKMSKSLKEIIEKEKN